MIRYNVGPGGALIICLLGLPIAVAALVLWAVFMLAVGIFNLGKWMIRR